MIIMSDRVKELAQRCFFTLLVLGTVVFTAGAEPALAVVNGICGSANGGSYAAAPLTGLCTLGTPSSATGIGPWSWNCTGLDGGTTAACSAAQAGGIVHKSIDAGSNWTPGKTGLGFNNNIKAILPSPSYISNQNLFIGTMSGIYRSSDNGDSWAPVVTAYNITSFAASPAFTSDTTLFAGAYLNGVYKSTDAGATWNLTNTGLGNTMIFSLAISPAYASDHTIFAGLYSKGVYKSTDSGGTWSAANTGIAAVHAQSIVISPAYATDRTIFVATSDNHVYKSVDAGGTWSLADAGLSGANLLAISPAFASDQTLFAATGSGIFRTHDSGNSWTRVNTATSVNGLALSPLFASDQTVLASAYGDNVYRSSNGGSSWSVSNSSFAVGNKQLVALALSPAFAIDQTVFTATSLTGPYIVATPGALPFGNVKTNSSSASRQVTITNGSGMFGDANLAISAMPLSGTDAGQFSISPGSCGSLTPVIPVNASCSVDIIFRPTSSGSKSATLQITHNNLSQSPASISLSGSGVTATSTVTSPATGYATQGSTVGVSGTAAAIGGGTVTLVEVSANGGSTWQPASGTTSWSATLSTPLAQSYSIKSRATTSDGIVETPGSGITVIVDRTPPNGSLALYYGVWTLNANATDGSTCILVYPNLCGSMEMSLNGSTWQPATMTPGTGGPLWLRDMAGNQAFIGSGTLSNSNGGPIRFEGGSSTYYSTLQHAVNAAGSGTVIKLTTTPYSENLVATTNTALTLRGGYNSGYGTVSGTTPLSGSLTVQTGALTIENFDVSGSMTVEGGAVTANAISLL